MKRDELARALEILKAKKRKRHFRMMISVLSVFTLLITSFSLSGVGITLSSEASDRVGLKKIAGPTGANNTYTISGETAWADLETLIENKTSGTYNVIVDGPIAADRQIKLNSGVTLNLSGTNNGTIYTASNVSQKFNEMIWANGATLNISDVTFSGQLAEFSGKSEGTKCEEKTVADMLERSKVSYTPGVEANACMETVWNPDIANSENPTINGTALYVNGTHINQIGTEGVWVYSIKSDKSDFTNASLDSKVGEIIVLANKVVNKNTTDAKFFAMSVDGSSASWESATLSDVASYGRFQWAKTWTTETSGAFSASERSNGKSVLRPNVDGYEGYISSSKEYKTLKIQQQKQGCTVVSAENATIAKLSIGDGNEIEAEVRAHSPLATSGGFAVKVIERKVNDGRHYPYAANENPVQATSLVDGTHYFLQTNNSGIIKYLDASTNGWNENVPSGYSGEAVGSADAHSQLWKYTDGVFKNIKTGKVLYFDGTNVSLKSLTEKVSGPFGCIPESEWNDGSWIPNENSAIDDSANSPLNTSGGKRGLFIAADSNANINLNSNSYFKDITYNGSAVDLAPIYVNGANVTIDGATFENNSGVHAGALEVAKDASNVTINNITVQNNTARLPENSTYSSLVGNANNRSFSSRASRKGGSAKNEAPSNKSAGAISMNGGTVTLANGTITGNTGDAGAVFVQSGTFNQTGGTIKNNHGFNGGAVVVNSENAKYNFTNGSLEENDSVWYGGAITALHEGYVTVAGAIDSTTGKGAEGSGAPIIKKNKTLDQGGGIYVHSNNVEIKKALIEENEASLMGGGIYVYGGDVNENDANSVLKLNEAYIYNNTADKNAASAGWADNYGQGDGIWLCSYGSVIMDSTKAHMWNNTSAGNTNDFYKVSGKGIVVRFDTSDTAVGGGSWTDSWSGRVNGENVNPFSHPKQNDGSADPYFVPSQGEYALVQANNYDSRVDNNSVIIRGNKAGYAGGGIGANGVIAMLPGNEKIYSPELSFTKSWVDANGNPATPSANYKAQYIIKIWDITGNEPKLAKQYGTEEAPIVLSQDGSGNVISNEGNNALGYEVHNWTAKFNLPLVGADGQAIKKDGKSIYETLVGSAEGTNINANATVDQENGTYSLNDMLKIEVIEISSTGEQGFSYDLNLNDMTYSKQTRSIYSRQRDVIITFDTLTLHAGGSNKPIDNYARVVLNKTDLDGNVIDAAGTFKYRKVNEDHSAIAGEAEYTMSRNANKEYETGKLEEGYYEIWEASAPTGFTLLADTKMYIKVDANGVASSHGNTGSKTNLVQSGTWTARSESDPTGYAGKYTFTLKNEKLTGLEIVKVDERNQPLTGETEFEVWSFDGKKHKKIATTTNNIFTIENIEEWFKETFHVESSNPKERRDWLTTKYYIKEVKAPSDKYEMLESVIPFEIKPKEMNGVTTYEFKRLDNTLNNQTNGNYTLVDGVGEIKVNGERTQKEYIHWASNGIDIKDVTYSYADGLIRYTVKNYKKKVPVNVVKVDEFSKALEGATFTIRKAAKTNDSVYEMTERVDANHIGYHTFANTNAELEVGEVYCFWESVVPNGYMRLGQEADGSVGGVDIPFIINSDKTITILKTDEEIAKIPANATLYPGTQGDLETWKATWNKVKDLVTTSTDSEGTAIITMPNIAKRELEIAKVDENSKPLTGAEFSIQEVNEDGSEIDGKAAQTMSNSQGTNKHKYNNLEVGKYYKITETKSPDKYKDVNDSVIIKVLKDSMEIVGGANSELSKLIVSSGVVKTTAPYQYNMTIKNEPYLGVEIEITKVATRRKNGNLVEDTDNNYRMEGVQFKIVESNKDGQIVKNPSVDEILTIGEDGKVSTGKVLKPKSQSQPAYYKIYETKAPEGYLELNQATQYIVLKVEYDKENHRYKVTVNKNTIQDYTKVVDTDNDKKLKQEMIQDDGDTDSHMIGRMTIYNEVVTYTLPETGGQGTWTCTIVGSLMILIGALLLGKKYFLSEVKG